jgi:hypothetical protein
MPLRRGAAMIAGVCLGLVLVCGLPDPAAAHRQTPDPDSAGIEFLGLTHGQMQVIAEYRARIIRLAARPARTDETFRRLLNFANLQYATCLWGLMPRGIADEASPFNECSHAYLSATQAVLIHMRRLSTGRDDAVEQLISRIDAEMARTGAAFVLCGFSNDSFTTSSLIIPRWQAVLFHGPSLLGLAFLLLAPLLVVMIIRQTFPAQPQ